MSHSQKCPQCCNALQIHFNSRQWIMFFTQWIKHAEATMMDHPNHPVPSGYKLREVPRVCMDCKTKRVGSSYSRCYTCRKTSQVHSWSEPNEYDRILTTTTASPTTMPCIDEKPVVTFTRGQESPEPNECNPTNAEPLVTFTYYD
jgi:hypothetical protein